MSMLAESSFLKNDLISVPFIALKLFLTLSKTNQTAGLKRDPGLRDPARVHPELPLLWNLERMSSPC